MKNSFLAFFYVCLLIAIVPFYVLGDKTFNKSALLNILLLTGLVLIVFLFKREKYNYLKKNYFRPLVLFLIGYIVVHFQLYIDILLNNLSENNAFIFVNNSVICKSALLSLIGLICFLMGYIIYNPKIKEVKTDKRIYPIKPLSIVSFIFLISFVRFVGADYILGGYGSVELSGTISAYLEILLQLSLYSIIIINTYNARVLSEYRINIKAYIKSYGILFYISLFSYIILVILSGDRGPAIFLGVAYIFSYFIISRKKISLPKFVMLIIIGGVIVTILGIARSFSGEVSSFSKKIEMAVSGERKNENMSFSPYTEELAGSVRTLHYAIFYVPQIYPYFGGTFQIKYVLSVIPFISVVTNSFMDNSFKNRSSANFITWLEQGDYPSSGTGSTCIADLYLDFGLLGVIIFMFLFGLLIRRLEIQMYSHKQMSLWWYVIGSYLMFIAIYISRSSILFHLRNIVWLFVIICLYRYLVRHLCKTKKSLF